MNKRQRHQAIRDRAAEAIRDMYHNATVTFPEVEQEGYQRFESWFCNTARFEIEYIEGGGAYMDWPTESTLDFIRSKYESRAAGNRAARNYHNKKGLDRARFAAWEWASRYYGKIYQWGRGGRTLAPENLIRQWGGGAFGFNLDVPDSLTMEGCTDLIRIIESFNEHVAAWCDSIPGMWAEVEAERIAEENAAFARVLEAERPDMYGDTI